MTHRTPPRLATWLMKKLHLPEMNPPLMGDLVEEFRAGRSPAWYWRQAVSALLTCWLRGATAARAELVTMFLSWAAQAAVVYELWMHDIRLSGWPGLVLLFIAVALWWVVPRTLTDRCLFGFFDAVEALLPEAAPKYTVGAVIYFLGCVSVYLIWAVTITSLPILLTIELFWLMMPLFSTAREAAVR